MPRTKSTECDACRYTLIPPVPSRCPECGNDLTSARLEMHRRDLATACRFFVLAMLIPPVALATAFVVAAVLSWREEILAIVLGAGLGIAALAAIGLYVLGLGLLAGSLLMTSRDDRRSHQRLGRTTTRARTLAALPPLVALGLWAMIF